MEVKIPKISDEHEEVISNLFSRVVEIFTKDNRTLPELYQAIDLNRDGKISEKELRAELIRSDKSITAEECKAVFDIIDGDGSGFVSLEELQKRMKLLKDKADEENKDPLACIIISKPLDPNLINGNLSIMLLKGQGLKPGTHSIKIKIKNHLEYIAPDTIELNPTWNFRCEYLFENQKENEICYTVDVDVFNKNKLEGTASFKWEKAKNVPNEFSHKVKAEIKTSTGQHRGFLFFQAQWTPIIVALHSHEELEKLNELEESAKRYQLEKKSTEKKPEEYVIKNEEEEEEVKLPRKATMKKPPQKPGAYIYVIKKTTKTLEKIIQEQRSPLARLPSPKQSKPQIYLEKTTIETNTHII